MVLHAALDRVEHVIDPSTRRRVAVLPADLGPVHAVMWTRGRITAPVFDASLDTETLCGRTARVVLPQRFALSDREACPRCRREAPPQERADEATSAAQALALCRGGPADGRQLLIPLSGRAPERRIQLYTSRGVATYAQSGHGRSVSGRRLWLYRFEQLTPPDP